jgi:hypothetical protein
VRGAARRRVTPEKSFSADLGYDGPLRALRECGAFAAASMMLGIFQRPMRSDE